MRHAGGDDSDSHSVDISFLERIPCTRKISNLYYAFIEGNLTVTYIIFVAFVQLTSLSRES